MYDTFVAYGLQYLLHKWRMKFYCKTYATALLCEFLQHIGRILNAYFPEDKPAEIFLTAVQYGMPHRESVRRLLYDSDFNPVQQQSYYDSDTSLSSKYPFYVTLGESDGLLLGQHVYIEPRT